MCNPSFADSLLPPSPSSSSSYNNYYRATRIARKPSVRSIAASSPVFFCDSISDDDKPRYFLDACSLCKAPLRVGDDIYMYRGDTPFCSEECRQEQIDIDEARERSNKMKKASLNNSIECEISGKSREIHARAAETVVAV